MAKKLPKCATCGDEHAAPREKCVRHNGWRNYETWAVNLWIDNTEASQDYWCRIAKGFIADAPNDSEARRKLAQGLKEEITNETNDSLPQACLAGDLLSAALSEVDWNEIAESMIRNIRRG